MTPRPALFDESISAELAASLLPVTSNPAIRTAWNAKEVVRQLYDHTDPSPALEAQTVTLPTEAGTTVRNTTPQSSEWPDG